MSTKPVLSISGLDVALRSGASTSNVIHDLNLEVHANEIVCVVGESGSGKSVTSQAIMLPKAKSALMVRTFLKNRNRKCAPCAAPKWRWYFRSP